MAHIWSDDLISGFTYDGQWQLNGGAGLVKGTLELGHHHIDDKDIPWIYPGINELEVLILPSSIFLVDFGTISTARESNATATALKAAFDAVLPVTLDTVFYDSDTDLWAWGFSGALSLLWPAASSTAKLAFNKVGAPSSATSASQVASGRHATNRPATLELEVLQTDAKFPASRITQSHFFVPTADVQLQKMRLSIKGVTSLLDFTWSRINAPGIPVPMTNQWELQFV